MKQSINNSTCTFNGSFMRSPFADKESVYVPVKLKIPVLTNNPVLLVKVIKKLYINRYTV